MRRFHTVLAVVLMTGPTAAWPHGDEQHRPRTFDESAVEQKDFGRAGNPTTATRTMTIRMSDTMRFTPAEIDIKAGETVRFIVKNDGKTLHEMVLGTEPELTKHAEMMRRFPGMTHDEPYMVHVKPGKTGDIVWTFNRPGNFRFACLISGHYEAGMVGRVVVR